MQNVTIHETYEAEAILKAEGFSLAEIDAAMDRLVAAGGGFMNEYGENLWDDGDLEMLRDFIENA